MSGAAARTGKVSKRKIRNYRKTRRVTHDEKHHDITKHGEKR